MVTTNTQAGASKSSGAKAGASSTCTAPSTSARARADESACGALDRPLPWGVGTVFLAIHPMASASLCCPIRCVVVLVTSGSSKLSSSARLFLHFGRRGRAVQIPA